MIAGQFQNKAKNVFKGTGLILPVGTFKGQLEELGINPGEEENKRLMGKAGKAGDGGEGWQEGKEECFMCMQGVGGGHKENIGLEKKKCENVAQNFLCCVVSLPGFYQEGGRRQVR